jgi:superfamily I DNA/RNA helicase
MQLNKEQAMAVNHDGHCLVVACPGSGKTRVIVRKIERLLSNPDNRVVAVTFTREGADELRSRVVESIGAEFTRRSCQIGTFHSLSIRLLRRDNLIGNILGPAEQYAFLARARAAAAPEMSFEDAVQVLERAKCSLSSCVEQESQLYLAYNELLARNKVEDLYDVLRRSVELMRDGTMKPFGATHLLVDEFQDTDLIQYAWVMEHAKRGIQVTAVGDDDQTIFSWRRALGYPGMESFRDELGAKLILLNTNYRCRSEILSSAGQLISNSAARIPKNLEAARGKGGTLHSIRAATKDLEAANVAEWAMRHATPIQDEYYQWTLEAGKCAVLSRNRKRLDIIETELRDSKIMFNRPPKDSVWSRTPYIYLLGLLQSIQNGDSDGIDHALHWGGISHQDIESVHRDTKGEIWRLMHGHEINKNSFEPEVAKQIIEFSKLAMGWRKMAKAGHYNMVLRAVTEWFVAHSDRDDEKELLPILCESVCRLSGSLVQRCRFLSGANANKPGAETQKKKAGVSLMTMHSSKGLEFEHVWIIATEATTIPSSKSLDYEEELRLMYVAMTRAKDSLSLSSVVTEAISPFVLLSGLDPREK